jgi:hypothetical protein
MYHLPSRLHQSYIKIIVVDLVSFLYHLIKVNFTIRITIVYLVALSYRLSTFIFVIALHKDYINPSNPLCIFHNISHFLMLFIE